MRLCSESLEQTNSKTVRRTWSKTELCMLEAKKNIEIGEGKTEREGEGEGEEREKMPNDVLNIHNMMSRHISSVTNPNPALQIQN